MGSTYFLAQLIGLLLLSVGASMLFQNTVQDAFVCAGCADEPQQAVTVESGAIWGQVYDVVTTKAGRYVQGGGCMTVGVAGLIQSGGFGSFSKRPTGWLRRAS